MPTKWARVMPSVITPPVVHWGIGHYSAFQQHSAVSRLLFMNPTSSSMLHDVENDPFQAERTLSGSKLQSRPNSVLECKQNTAPPPQPGVEQEEILQSSASTVVALDIEHAAVTDDPRLWPRKRKVRLPINNPSVSERGSTCLPSSLLLWA